MLSPALTQIVFSVFVHFDVIPVELVLASSDPSGSPRTEHFGRVHRRVVVELKTNNGFGLATLAREQRDWSGLGESRVGCCAELCARAEKCLSAAGGSARD